MTQRRYVEALLGSIVAAAIGCSSDSTVGVPRNVDASSQAIRAAVHSNAAIAAKLAGALQDRPGNLFYSPLSIEAVSGMLLAGAAGDTAIQLASALDAEDDPSALHEGLGSLLRDLRHESPQYALSVANRLWAQPGLASSRQFTDTTRDQYDAPTQQADFTKDPEAVRSQINRWVSQETAGKIPELLQEGQITSLTVMAVVNAIYFKADWASAFDKSRTRPGAFHRAGESEVTVDMMSSDEIAVRTAGGDGRRWLELPYRTGEVSFLAFVQEIASDAPPSAVASVQELQEDLKDVDIDAVVAGLNEGHFQVQMPRFSLRSRIDLVPVFKQLGVTDLFDSQRADLTKISAGGGLYVDPFVHEATVQVDELGTVAAAATAGGGVLLSAPPRLRLDHPFLFFIRDNLTGAILFSGRVADPTESSDD